MSDQNQSLPPAPLYLRMCHLATTAERPSRTYKDKNGKVRLIKGRPAKTGLIPMGESTIWEKTKNGEFPKPVKLSEHITAWKAEDVLNWLASKEEVYAA